MRRVPIRFVTIGASIMAGQGIEHGQPALAKYLFDWLDDRFPGLVNASNGAVPGITSQYMSVCHNLHVPSDADVVIVDFAVNDGYKSFGSPYLLEPRPAFERLVRKLLSYPNRPTVVLLHAYAWSQTVLVDSSLQQGRFWNNAEREVGEFERFYHLPSLSVKACCYHKMYAGVEGFVAQPRLADGATEAAPYVGAHFYFDIVHPDARTGARVMAELVFHLLVKVFDGLEDRPLSDAERALAAAPLPPPMIPGNYEATSSRCFIGGSFTAVVQGAHSGWEWINESKTQRPKFGFISTTPGSVIRLQVDTRATTLPHLQQRAHANVDKALVQLSHLRSYENMGQALVTCEGGCACNATIMDGHRPEQHDSLAHLHEFFATMAEACVVAVTVSPTTRSGSHKVKLIGIVVSEVAGSRSALCNHDNGAAEFVGDISIRGSGNFDMKNSA